MASLSWQQGGCLRNVLVLLADNVHYVNGPGEVLHAFDSEAAEELSVYAGEEASPFPPLKVAQSGCASQNAL